MGRARVVIVRSEKVWTASGELDPAVVARMFARGSDRLDPGKDGRAAAASLFRPDDRIGIKINTIGGRALSTRPETALALARWLAAAGFPEKNLFIWDRTTRGLRGAGVTPGAGRTAVRVVGTDTDGVGYGPDLVSHRGVGSVFSKIQTE